MQSIFSILYSLSEYFQIIPKFIYDIAHEEKDFSKQKNIEALKLEDEEWERVELLIKILKVMCFNLILSCN